MLDLTGVCSGYGETQVLYGLNLTAEAGKVTAILGRNGAGKSTTLKTVMGLLPVRQGEVRFQGHALNGKPPYVVADAGIGYVPETRDIFPSLSVRENLELAASRGRSGDWTMDTVIDLFPRLGERLANGGQQLSGGEQQMLAIARALLLNPVLLMLDEPTEGLAPIIVKLIYDKLQELRRAGQTIVLVEQNFGFATALADDVAVVGKGEVVWTGTPADIRADSKLQHTWLGV
jgi:branched-chain amino acid transport system ATP-binding protein